MKVMPTSDHQNRSPRVFIQNARIFRSLSYSYHKLPKALINLSVLKLDGSSFGVEVPMNATVAELKLALEEVFYRLPKEEQCTISWSHVWAHFCLCYDGKKLLNDKAYIRRLGIKDGDQIKFVRHITINYRPARHRSKNQSHELRPRSKSRTRGDREQTDANKHAEDQVNFHGYQCEEEAFFLTEPKATNFLRGWLSYRKFCSN